jgi:hypothetical protein
MRLFQNFSFWNKLQYPDKGDFMQANSHNQAIPEAVITAAETAIDAQLQALAPYATPLTAEDRHNLLKTGPKTFQFVELAHTLAEENPQLTSKAFDMAAFTTDWNDAHNLLGVENKARQLLELIEDIRMAAGSDSARQALEVYADFKAAAGRNVPEARAAYEQLKAAYPSKGRKHRTNESEQT